MTTETELPALRKKVRQLELAIDIGKRFSSTLDVEKLMSTILDSVVEALEAEACSFWMREEGTKEVGCHVAVGPSKEKILGMRLKVGSGVVGWVVGHKEKVVLFDASKDKRFNTQADKKSGFATKSMLCVPLVVNDECMGAIQLLNKKSHLGTFDQDDLEMLELLAVNAAISIKNALLYNSEKRIKELNHLLDLSKQITSTLDLDRVLMSIVNLGSKVIFYERALIGIVDFHDKLSLAAESHVAAVDRYTPHNKKLTAIMRQVLESGKPLQVVNFHKERPPKELAKNVCEYMEMMDLHSLSIAILSDSEGKLGVISMEGQYGTLVGKDSSYVIDMIVNQATVAIRNAQLYKNIPKGGLVGKLSEAVHAKKWSRKKVAITSGISVFALALLLMLKVPHRVTVDLEVIPDHQTQATSRVDGVVTSVLFEEGQLVEKGQVLVRLNRSPLELERSKLRADHQMSLSKLRRWQSEEVASEAHLERLEAARLESELELIEQKINHTEIVAPASGRILTPRPRELLDKQIVMGETITNIAVSDRKRLKVVLDEASTLIARVGNPVYFSLKALPDQLLEGELLFTSQSPTVGGYEAYLFSEGLNRNPNIRLGMTGLAKIHTGNRSLYHIYLRKWKESFVTSIKLFFHRGA